MSRSRNGTKFLQEYRRIRYQYEEDCKKQLEKIQAKYIQSHVEEILEAHLREFFVNAFLEALNWRMKVNNPNLIPESSVTSASSGTRLFLDYFGIEQETAKPLLIVETKRPGISLPVKQPHSDKTSMKSLTEDSRAVVIASGLADHPLIPKKWNEWLSDLREYVKSVNNQSGHIPKRVVLTNGQWLILFSDPADSFLSSGPCDHTRIFIYEFEKGKRDDIVDKRDQIFELLEHQKVLGETPPLTVGEVPFYITPENVSDAMHGLRVIYLERKGIYEPSPHIGVAPVVFLRSNYGAWLCIESRIEESVPHNYKDLGKHLQTIQERAIELLATINQYLGIQLRPASLVSHYDDEERFDSLKGIKTLKSERNFEEFVIVTGEYTHYLKPEPTIPTCPYHDSAFSRQQGRVESQLVSIQHRSINPRSFFFSRENHHCAHSDVASAKSSPITPENKNRCGSRSGKDYDAFCEIQPFEKHLCCRTCAFEEVCTNTQVFKLPCNKESA